MVYLAHAVIYIVARVLHHVKVLYHANELTNDDHNESTIILAIVGMIGLFATATIYHGANYHFTVLQPHWNNSIANLLL